MGVAPRAAIGRLPDGPGVYRFRDARGRALYIGRAVNLRRRVGSYWADLGDRRHLVRMVPQIAGLEAVVHEPLDAADLFGPYLGGTQARLAVSGLDRVLPLGYTEDRLSGAQRDLARARGIAAADREAMLATVTAVLRRQPDAVETVRQHLAGQRDRAATSLAFELAARIQQEIEAVDWVVAEQKVTAPHPTTDCDVYGWADGLLVRFEIRDGRLCTWTQRSCQPAAARRFLDQTPAGWHRFAARGAELARRLTEVS